MYCLGRNLENDPKRKDANSLREERVFYRIREMRKTERLVLFGAIALIMTIFCVLGVSLLTTFASMPSPDTRRVLFGTLKVSDEFSWGLYLLMKGAIGLFACYGLAKANRICWYIVMASILNTTTDGLIQVVRFPISSSVGTIVGLCIIVWLIVRRDALLNHKLQ